MHGTYEANNAMHDCDLMINIGARFDDRITGKIDEFSPNSKKIHIDIDPSSINKNVKVDTALVGDVKLVLEKLISVFKKKHPDFENSNKPIFPIVEPEKICGYVFSYGTDNVSTNSTFLNPQIPFAMFIKHCELATIGENQSELSLISDVL